RSTRRPGVWWRAAFRGCWTCAAERARINSCRPGRASRSGRARIEARGSGRRITASFQRRYTDSMADAKTLKLAVLLSGSGTTLENLFEKSESGELPAQVVFVG